MNTPHGDERGKCDTSNRRATVAVLVAAWLLLAATGCAEGGGGGEGDRCNPDLSHDECNSGLTCTIVTAPAAGGGYFTCGESYCCPSGPSGNGYCNGVNIAPSDGVLQCPAYCPATSTTVPVLSVGSDFPDGGLDCPDAGT
jgi:hypothetical protein